MQITLGFAVVLIFVVFPGLLFRRLFYFSEFSKQFNAGLNTVSLLAVSSVPGLINLIGVFFFYDCFIEEIELGSVIDRFKEINQFDPRLPTDGSSSFKSVIIDRMCPFVGFMYLTSFMLGAVSGRLIRFTRLDTRLKLFRFKNYWFYLFKGEFYDRRKFKHLKNRGRRNGLFAKADILVDTEEGPKLYSGIVVDYILSMENSEMLSKVVLKKPERYYKPDNENARKPVTIPGDVMVVDCSRMININLTYFANESTNVLTSKVPENVEIGINILIFLLVIPLSIFKLNVITLDLYTSYFSLNILCRILAVFMVIQSIRLFNPFVKDQSTSTYSHITWKIMLLRAFYLYLFSFLLYLFM